MFPPYLAGDASAATIWDNYNWYSSPENVGRTDPMILNQHLIHHLLPEAKFILIVRDPVNRYVLYDSCVHYKVLISHCIIYTTRFTLKVVTRGYLDD